MQSTSTSLLTFLKLCVSPPTLLCLESLHGLHAHLYAWYFVNELRGSFNTESDLDYTDDFRTSQIGLQSLNWLQDEQNEENYVHTQSELSSYFTYWCVL